MSIPQQTFSCIIADDDEIDRLTTAMYCRKYPFLEVKEMFASPLAALSYVQQNTTDVMLLDIDMPGMSGIELRQQLQHIPACIFITSHPEFAIDSFELSVLDYLLKPINDERFAAAMERLKNYMDIRYKAKLLEHTLGGDTIYIKEGHQQFKIQLHDILYLEALKDYTGVVTKQRKYCVLTPLGTLLNEDAFRSFIRIHRSFAVQKHFIDKVSAKEISVGNTALPVGRSYKESLQHLINT